MDHFRITKINGIIEEKPKEPVMIVKDKEGNVNHTTI